MTFYTHKKNQKTQKPQKTNQKKKLRHVDKWMMISYWFELKILNLNTMIMKNPWKIQQEIFHYTHLFNPPIKRNYEISIKYVLTYEPNPNAFSSNECWFHPHEK